jgi:hypothetical protein
MIETVAEAIMLSMHSTNGQVYWHSVLTRITIAGLKKTRITIACLLLPTEKVFYLQSLLK